MVTITRKHIAASGAKKGQYVDCNAAKCRLGAGGHHVPLSMFGGAKLWLQETRGPVTDAQITPADVNRFMHEPAALDYVNRYEQQLSTQRLNTPWSYRSNYEYNLSGLDSAAFMAACERFNSKNKTAEITYDVVLQQHRNAATVQVPVGITHMSLPLNRDIYKFKHVQITGNPNPRELQRLTQTLQVFVTGKAGQKPQLDIFKTP